MGHFHYNEWLNFKNVPILTEKNSGIKEKFHIFRKNETNLTRN